MEAYTGELLRGAYGADGFDTIYIEFIAFHLAKLKVAKKVTIQVLERWVRVNAFKRSIEKIVNDQYKRVAIAEGVQDARQKMQDVERLTLSARQVYGFLFKEARAQFKNAYAPIQMGYATIQKGTTLSVNTIRRALEELEDQGYVVLVAKGGTQTGGKRGQGANVPSTYRLLTPKERNL